MGTRNTCRKAELELSIPPMNKKVTFADYKELIRTGPEAIYSQLPKDQELAKGNRELQEELFIVLCSGWWNYLRTVPESSSSPAKMGLVAVWEEIKVLEAVRGRMVQAAPDASAEIFSRGSRRVLEMLLSLSAEVGIHMGWAYDQLSGSIPDYRAGALGELIGV